jgi:hypothetical protein
MILVVTWFKYLLPSNISAITLWPFIIFKLKSNATDDILLNHEKIHLKQQIELGVIPFYLIYLLEYLFGLIKHRSHDKAYRSISFEQEAYQNDSNLGYIKTRRFYAMWHSRSQ